MSNVEIVDISNYIPKDYKYSPNLVKEDYEEAENINELLEDEKFEQENIKRKGKQLIDLDEHPQQTIHPFKPGKLNGRLLAKMSNDLKLQESKKAEEDLYFLTFGGSKPKTEETTEYGWKKVEEVEEKETEQEVSFDAASLFESILGVSSPSTPRPTESRPLTRPPSRTNLTASTTQRSTTLGICGSFCSFHASIFISSGLDWTEVRYSTTAFLT